METKSIMFAVCDKNQEEIKATSLFISEFYNNKGKQPEIQCFDDTDKIIDAFRRQNGYVAVFMGMNSMDEVDTAWILRNIAPRCRLVIMSPCGDYSLEGYRLEAFDYWLKPLDVERFNKTLERLEAHV